MASPPGEPSVPSIRHGVRIVPLEANVSVEEVLLCVGEEIGHDSLLFASRMNKAVVVFMKEERHVNTMIEKGVVIRDSFTTVSPLAVPSIRITISGVPPFIDNALLEQELRRFGKFASGFKPVALGCKDARLKHVQSLRRQVFMFLDAPSQTLDVSFRVKYGEGSYMVYASSGQMKCFECGDVGHKRHACPHRGTQPSNVGADVHTARSDSSREEGEGEGGQSADRGETVPVTAGPAVSEVSALQPQTVATAAQVIAIETQAVLSDRGEQPVTTVNEQAVPSSSVQGGTGSNVEVTGKVPSSQATNEDDIESMFDTGDESDLSSMADSSYTSTSDLYTLKEINDFLDNTFRQQSVKIADYFPDTDRFIRSVGVLQKVIGFDELEEKKRFRLRKHLANLRRGSIGEGTLRKKRRRVTDRNKK